MHGLLKRFELQDCHGKTLTKHFRITCPPLQSIKNALFTYSRVNLPTFLPALYPELLQPGEGDKATTRNAEFKTKLLLAALVYDREHEGKYDHRLKAHEELQGAVQRILCQKKGRDALFTTETLRCYSPPKKRRIPAGVSPFHLSTKLPMSICSMEMG
jgi:hypothetical protein